MLFACSYAFQISGAIILLLWSLRGIKANVLDLYFSDSNVIERDNNDMCVLAKEKLQKKLQTIFQNIFAFADLIVGYSLALFAQSLFESYKTFVITEVLTVIIIVAEYFASIIIAKVKYPKDVSMSFAEIQKYKPDVSTFTTNKEVDDMFNEVFGAEPKE